MGGGDGEMPVGTLGNTKLRLEGSGTERPTRLLGRGICPGELRSSGLRGKLECMHESV